VFVRPDGAGAIVVDGATSKTGILVDGHTEGWWAAEFAVREFAALGEYDTLHDYVHKAHEAIAGFARHRKDCHPHAVFAAYYRGQIGWVGDCVALEINAGGRIIDQHTTPVAPDHRTAALRSEVITTLLKYDLPPAEVARVGRNVVQPWIRGQVQFANAPEPPQGTVDWTYGVLAKTPVPERFIGRVRLNPLTERIMLYSDGFPYPAARLQRLQEKLMDLRHTNPHCIAQNSPYYPGSSKGFVDETTGELNDYYDDTTAVELQLDAL
jgi:hypothetical protein